MILFTLQALLVSASAMEIETRPRPLRHWALNTGVLWRARPELQSLCSGPLSYNFWYES